MKKFISILMILAVLLSLCACGEKTPEATEPSEEVTEEATQSGGLQIDMSPEALYGHIDQTKPNDKGVYKIWSAESMRAPFRTCS